jgi:hypothetical protein
MEGLCREIKGLWEDSEMRPKSPSALFINVDLTAIVATRHRCSGCFTAKACCCAKYEVCASLRELKTIIGALPLAVKYCPWLKGKNGYENVFDETERGLFAIDTHENGLCVFAYHCDSGIRCSLHTVAGQMGMSPHLVKPYACTLWPLVMREPPYAALSITEDALQFPCNRTRKKKVIPLLREGNVGRHCVSARRDAVPAYNDSAETEALQKKDDVISPEILYSIEKLLGVAAAGKIVKAAKKGLRRTRVPLHGPLAGAKR